MGRWLALSGAQAGFRVMLEDVLPSNLHHARQAIRKELNPDTPRSDSDAQVTLVSTIEDAVRTADLAIDCVPDELESKLEILWLLDRMAPPHTVFATPTTQLAIADLGACTYRPEKCLAIGASPAELAGLAGTPGAQIVLRAAPATAPETIALVAGFWRRLGFVPVVRNELRP